MISHGIFPILPPNCTKFVPFWPSLRNEAFSDVFGKMSRIENGGEGGHGKSRNGHGKVMEKCFVKCVGTLIKAQSFLF